VKAFTLRAGLIAAKGGPRCRRRFDNAVGRRQEVRRVSLRNLLGLGSPGRPPGIRRISGLRLSRLAILSSSRAAELRPLALSYGLQAWLQVLLPVITAIAMIAGWRSWSGRCVVRASQRDVLLTGEVVLGGRHEDHDVAAGDIGIVVFARPRGTGGGTERAAASTSRAADDRQ
jgi:hypothetical protein